jgi:limonene-1,2-epoxide hydrolase
MEVVALDERISSPPESDGRAVGRNPVVALAIVVAFVSGGFVGWFVGSRSDDSDATAPAESVELVEEWAEAVRAEDAERISKLYTEDAVWYDDALGDRFTGVAGAYTGWNIFGAIDGVTSVDVIAIGEDGAAVRWTFGLPGDEEITGVSILELDDGLISAETVYYDSAQAP